MKTRAGTRLRLRILFAAAVIALAGCSPPPEVHTAYKGKIITEHPGVPCPIMDAPGCYLPDTQQLYYYPTGDMIQRAHEFEHVDGMRHTPWETRGPDQCATITAQGTTKWRVGDLICMVPGEQYVKAR